MEGKMEYRHGVDGNPHFINVPDYVYHFRTLGNFFDEEHVKWHNIMPGEYFFKNKEDNDELIDKIANAYNTYQNIGDMTIDCAKGYHVYEERGIKFIFKCKDNEELRCLKYPLPASFPFDFLKHRIENMSSSVKQLLDDGKEYELISAVLYGEWDISDYTKNILE